MYSIEELQSKKLLPATLKTLDGIDEVVSITECSEERIPEKPVVVSNYLWIATVDGKDLSESPKIYSANQECVGVYNCDKLTFNIMQLSGDYLITKKSIIFKEGRIMADMSNINLDELVQEAAAEVKPVESFEGKEMTERQKATAEKRAAYDKIRSQIGAGSKNFEAPSDVVRNNFQFGRLFGFVTKSDDYIQLRVVPKQIKKDGKPVLTADAPAEVREAFAQGKTVAKKWTETEGDFTFSHAKPTGRCGVIVGTPRGTDLALTNIGKDDIHYDLSDNTLVYHVLPEEVGKAYIIYNYNRQIKESDAVLGASADIIDVVTKLGFTKDQQPKATTSFKPRKRKQLIVKGNYVPLSCHETISVQNPSAEDKVALNNNVLYALNKSGKVVLGEEAKKKYTQNGDTVSSIWFDEGAPIQVAAYDGSGDITNVRIPARDYKETKNHDVTYRFRTHKIADLEKGPLTMPEFKAVVDAIGLDVDTFITVVGNATRKGGAKAGGRGVDTTLSTNLYLEGMFYKNSLVGTKAIETMQSEIDAMLF